MEKFSRFKYNNSALESLEQKEFIEEIPVDEFLGDKESLSNSSTTRRDFLKFVGFSTAAAYSAHKTSYSPILFGSNQ